MADQLVDINNLSSPGRSQTTIQESKLTHIWEIDNLNLLSKDGKHFFKSAIFSSAQIAENRNKWSLELSPHLKKESDGTHVGLKDRGLSLYVFLHLVSSDEIAVSVKYEIFIKGNNEEFVSFGIRNQIVQVGCKTNPFFISGERLIKENIQLKETLTLLCQINTIMHSTSELGGEYASQSSIPYDLGCLFESQDLSDVTIVSADGREFRAHKAILGARSPVFFAMFKHEMTEKKQSKVEIADMGGDAILELLRCVYTGRADVSKNTEKLLAAADKYELLGLRDICKMTLSKNITVENAANTLILAELHSLEDLKERAIEFIESHSDEIKNTEGWKKFAKNYPLLVMEAFLFKERTK